MGSLAQGLLRTGTVSALVLLTSPALLAQVPAPAASADLPAPVPAPPGAAPDAPGALPPPPTAPPAAEPANAGRVPTPPPPDPAPPAVVAPPPAPLPRAPEPSRAPASKARARSAAFLRDASPWVDLSLTNFYFEDRVDNFMNLGVQGGAYLFDFLRVSLRLVAPLEEVRDSYSFYSYTQPFGSSQQIDSRSVGVLYGGTVGFVITNSRSFVFAPSLALMRTDVEAYGSAWLVMLPFEWTTSRNLRFGFEFGLGHAFDGQVRFRCGSGASGCGINLQDRPGGMAAMAQFYMGWSLGKL